MPDRDVEFEITANDKSARATEAAARNFEHLSDKADKAKRSVDELGDQSGQLARKLAEARAAAVGLAREFDRTGDSKILREFGKINAEAARLGRVAKTIKLDLPGGEVKTPDGLLGRFVKLGREAGLIAGDASIEGVKDAFSALPGQARTWFIGGLVGAAVATAPLLAATIEGAIVAGVGAGALGIGVLLAAQADSVQAAYSKLGAGVLDDLKRAAQPITDQILAEVPIIGYAFGAQLSGIQKTFQAVAPMFRALVADALAASEAILPSLERAAVVGSHILASVGQQLPGLARSVGQLLDAFSAAGPGAADALAALVQQLSLMIKLLALGAQASAPMLNALGALSEFLHLTPNSNKEISKLTTLEAASGTQAGLTAEQYAKLNGALGNTADQAKALGDAFSRLFGEQMGLDQANLSVNTGMLTLTDTIKGNTKTLDQSTAAGAQNAGVILQQIQNLDAKRQAEIAAGNGTKEATDKANAAYAANVQALRNVLIQLGLTAGEVDKLIGAYERIPQTITTTVTTVYRQVGSKSGVSDQATGHSRTGSADYGALSSWAPAAFTAGERSTAGAASGVPRTPPMEVHSELALTVELDGQPFRAMAARTTRAAEQRQAWRARVGARN